MTKQAKFTYSALEKPSVKLTKALEDQQQQQQQINSLKHEDHTRELVESHALVKKFIMILKKIMRELLKKNKFLMKLLLKIYNEIKTLNNNKQIFHGFLFNIRNYSPQGMNIQRRKAELDIILPRVNNFDIKQRRHEVFVLLYATNTKQDIER